MSVRDWLRRALLWTGPAQKLRLDELPQQLEESAGHHHHPRFPDQETRLTGLVLTLQWCNGQVVDCSFCGERRCLKVSPLGSIWHCPAERRAADLRRSGRA